MKKIILKGIVLLLLTGFFIFALLLILDILGSIINFDIIELILSKTIYIVITIVSLSIPGFLLGLEFAPMFFVKRKKYNYKDENVL